MKQIAFSLVALLVASGLALADPLRGVYFSQDSVSASTVTNTVTRKSQVGKALSVSVDCSTNLSMRLRTTKGVGSSLSAAKDIIASTNTTGSFQWNIGSDIFLSGDALVLETWSSGSTNIPVKVLLVVDPDN